MRPRPMRARAGLAALVAVVATAMMALAVAGTVSAAENVEPDMNVAENPFQRGPDPTLAMIEASHGPFATAQQKVAPGNGFNGGVVYYPTDTTQGTWGALAIVPGYTAKCAKEEAWMGPWLSSFGFVVICIETNGPNDYDVARGKQLLSALSWMTGSSPVKDRIDPNRLSVLGHSMGGGGVVYATQHQPSLKAGVALAPFSPSQTMAGERVPTLVLGGQKDPTVTPSYLKGLYAKVPASTPSAYAQIAGADHLYYTHPNNVQMKLVIPWLKIFVDNDTRYGQFLCPKLPDPAKISLYQSKCPYLPPGGAHE